MFADGPPRSEINLEIGHKASAHPGKHTFHGSKDSKEKDDFPMVITEKCLLARHKRKTPITENI